MCPRKNNLRSTRILQHIKNVCAYAVSPPIGFPWNLFPDRKHPIGLPQVYNDIAPIDSLNNTVKDFPLTVDETGIDGIFFGIFHFLDNDLFCRLGSYASKGAGIHLGTQAVADFTLRIQFAPFCEVDFNLRFGDNFSDFFELKDFNFTTFLIVLHFDIHLVAVFFSGSRS